MIVTKIISGGQTGADQGGLFAGDALGLQTGGTAPREWKTEKGSAPWLAEFGLVESVRWDYAHRTVQNVLDSHGTLIFGKRSPGSNKTEELCRIHDKPCLWIPYPDGDKMVKKVKLWLIREKVWTLNVAGNRESVSPGIEQFTKKFLMEVLK